MPASTAKSRADSDAAKTPISADYKAQRDALALQAGKAKQIGDARVDARKAKLDADCQVVVENCHAMAGDAKASCLSAAKASFGKR